MGEGTAEEEQRSLQHQRQRLHYVVEVPGNNAVKFTLSTLTAFDGASSQIGRRVSIQPLFAEHREKGGKKRGGETCEEDGLDVNYCAGRSCPLWEGWNVVTEGSVVYLVDEDTEESCCLVVRVLSELRVDLDDECGCDGREQTGLLALSARAHQSLKRLTKISVVFKSSSYFFMNSLSYSSASLR